MRVCKGYENDTAPIEYEPIREAEAKKLSMTVSALDAKVDRGRGKYNQATSDMQLFTGVEPGQEPVDAAILLQEIYDTVRRYIVCDTEVAVAVSLWIAFTWLIDHVQVAPLLFITAPEKAMRQDPIDGPCRQARLPPARCLEPLTGGCL